MLPRTELNARDAMQIAHELFSLADYDKAARAYQAVAILENGNFDAVHGVGVARLELKEFDQALTWLDRAGTVAITQLVAVALNKAVALGEMGRTHEAIGLLEGALQLSPNDPKIHFNLGVLRMQIELFDAAIQDFEKALSLDPSESYGSAKYARGFSNLVLGNYLSGFEDFEHRSKDYVPVEPQHGVEWTGQQPLAGKTILVHAEMGSGDTIQFGRYLPLMVECGAKINAVVHPGLRPLFEGAQGITLYGEDEAWPRSDYWVRLMSLARCFETTENSVPAPLSIVYDPSVMKRWRRVITQDTINIGLCWSGNPKSKYDVHRSIPARLFEPLVAIRERLPIRFYCFQQQVRESDREGFAALGLMDVGPLLTDFRETAHAMKCLDLMVTCDTSVAHMAGTVGIPTWVMLTKFRTYWLWMIGRDTTPWYPSMSCLKQTTDGDWPEVMQRVIDKLEDFMGQAA